MLDQAQTTNLLLAAMDPADFTAVTAPAVEVELLHHAELGQPDELIEHIWFPLSGIISVIAMDADGNQAEIGLVGVDGVVDITGMIGDCTGTAKLLVQAPGRAVRVRLEALRNAAEASPMLLRLLLAYVCALHIQLGGSALAFARYTLEQRLARWLLMAADRYDPGHLPMTHDTLAIMLGVRRAGVTTTLQKLAGTGVIKTTRGKIVIQNWERLLAIAGAGYGEPEAAYQRLVGQSLDRADQQKS